jgi:hypothetical protein
MRHRLQALTNGQPNQASQEGNEEEEQQQHVETSNNENSTDADYGSEDESDEEVQ